MEVQLMGDDVQEVKIGQGWRGGVIRENPIWLVDELDGGQVQLARWEDHGDGLVRSERWMRVSELLNKELGWHLVPQEQVDTLMEQLMHTSAADAAQALQQRIQEHKEAAEGQAIDRERVAVREAARADEPYEVPALAKSFWGKPEKPNGLQAETVIFDEYAEPPAEPRANAPMLERAGLIPPRQVTFEHDYPGAPGNPTDPGGWTSDCRHGCGCYAGPSTSGGRDKTVDPFGECPAHPELLAIKASPMYKDLVAGAMDELEAMRRVVEEGQRRNRMLRLSQELEQVSSRMLFEARELRLLAGVSDEEYAAATMAGPEPTTTD